jgi:hypothetical protein
VGSEMCIRDRNQLRLNEHTGFSKFSYSITKRPSIIVKLVLPIKRVIL